MGGLTLPVNATEQQEIKVIQIGENKYQVTDLDDSLSTLTYENMSAEQHTVHVETEDGDYTINADMNELTIKNETTGEVQNTEISEGEAIAISASPRYNIPSETAWKTNQKGKGKGSVTIGDAGMIVGVIAAISKLSPVTGVLVTVASWIAGRMIPEAYYIGEWQTRIWHGWVEQRWKTTYYTNSGYTTVVPGTKSVWTSPQKLHTVV
ncbi:hypothetical protein ACWG0P_02370 [Amedibacillus sp. YH-ame6]